MVINMSKTENNQSGARVSLKTRVKTAALYIPSLLLVIAGVYMFANTRGTRLLFISSSLGRVFRGWWIFLILAAVCFIAALILSRIIRKSDNVAQLEAGEEKSLLTDGRDKAGESAADNASGSKSADDKSADSITDNKSGDAKSTESKPTNNQSDDSKSTESQPTDSKPIKDIDTKIAEIDREFDELGVDTSDGKVDTSDVKDEKTKKPTLYCPECGAKLTEGAAFCMKCGKKLG